MEITGTNVVNAPRERVWEAINDPAVLARCVPGVSDVTRNGDTLRGALELNVGRFRGVYRGQVRVLTEQPPEVMDLGFEGQAPVGTIRARGQVRLEQRGELTVVHWRGEPQLTGMLALVGRRLMEGVVREKTDRFWQRLEAELKAGRT